MPDTFAAFSALVPPGAGAAPMGAVAVYAVVPSECDSVRVLDELRSYAAGQGWHVPAGCAAADIGPLGSDLNRSGWPRVRRAVQAQAVTGLVVPCFAHIGFRWADWNRERTWLLRHGLFVVATDPTELLVGVSPKEVTHP
ncbi:hypothetical protein OG365_41260 (plasmid) [Streptomyces sp. NBC_00853]|uniref:hypothetical protein n=1 Tax=Streptomyces sp. NBC_00853 TaxID=2903681 RepID=UPI002F90E622|nr:hypothetical protein OG365_41260 [Streptomyces sp. NBC_00853]